MGSCPNCGAPVRPQARFCSKCGTPLVTGAGIIPPPPPIPPFEKQSILQSAVPVQSPPAVEGIKAATVAAPAEAPLSVAGPASKETVTGGDTPPAVPPSATEVAGADAARDRQRAAESVPLVVGKAGVIAQRITIASKLMALVPFSKLEFREKNKDVFLKHIQQQVPIEENSWGQVAFIAGMYAPQMGGSRLNSQRKFDLWQALLWAVQYEYYFRPAQFADRFFRLAEFLNTCASDGDFQAIAFSSLETILPQFDKANLKNAREAVERLPVSFAITSLKQLLERYIALNDPLSILAALEQLWRWLDRSKEEQNRATISDVRQKGLTSQLTSRLLVLSVFVCKNLLTQSLAGTSSGSGISDEELQSALLLSAFICRHAKGNQAVEAQKRDSALKAMQISRASQPGTEGPEKSPNGSAPITMGPNPGKEDPKSDISSGQQQKTGVEGSQGKLEENPRRRLEAIFGEESLAKLLESMRNFRLDQMRNILRRVRDPLLSALSNALHDPSFDELVPPARTFYMRGNIQDESLPYLKKRLLSSDVGAQNDALVQLELASKGALDRENAALAREWLLFARARVLGLDKALFAWREDYNRGIASPEEIWNLAVVAVRSGDVLQALEILKPGVKEQRFPLSHLRFALKCGVDILQKEDNYIKAPVGAVATFLLAHLTQFPLPECYLVWLLLANDLQEAFDLSRQSEVIGFFLALLERPLEFLARDRRTGEITIEEFESDYRDLLSIVKQLEEHYTLEPEHGKIIIKSKTLATSLRVSQPIPKRVGLFVDYENLSPSLPPDLQANPKLVAAFLTQYASKYGDIACRWLCASPGNIFNFDAMAEEFQKADFKVQYPRGVTAQLKPSSNQADFVLVECIVHEMMHSKPDVYIIVSGDGHYFERVSRLIEQGNSVGLVASRSSISSRYARLEQRSKQGQLPEEYGPFFIDYLEDLLAAGNNHR
jgi:zinc-ribbon domain/NYN domain